MSANPQKHVVLFTYESWGHLRPMTVIAARIVNTKPIYVTFLVTPRLLERVQTELSRNFPPEDRAYLDLIRIIAIPLKVNGQLINFEGMHEAFASAYERLVRGEPIRCAGSGVTYDPIVSPTSAILDFFAGEPVKTIRSLSKSVKVYAWYSGAASFVMWPFGPEHRGGRPDVTSKIYAVAKETGRDIGEVAGELLLPADGTVVRVPGLPPMYDYEYYPQEMIMRSIEGKLILAGYTVLRTCDGVILSTSESYEPEAVESVKDWFAEDSRSVFTLGPLLPLLHDSRAATTEMKVSAKSNEIEKFLENVLASHGAKSMLYMSFGSLFWSTQPEKIWAFVDVLMEKKIPFIMSHASPFAVVPDEVREKVDKYGVGILSQWAPQQTILSHPVTGWFVTHGGHNGVTESITAGVPMICWPFGGDQPVNTVYVTEKLDVAYELLEVRVGLGLKPIFRNGKVPTGTIEALRKEAAQVLDNAFDKDGERKRVNLEKLREVVLGCWEEGGSSKRALDMLVEVISA